MLADALPQLGTIECETTSVGHLGLKMFQGLEQNYKKDSKTNDILTKIDAHPEFCVLQNKLYYTRKGRTQLYFPQGDFRELIMKECHDVRYASHSGVKKTTELIQRDFYWPTLLQDVVVYVYSCEECQRNKPSNQRKAGLL